MPPVRKYLALALAALLALTGAGLAAARAGPAASGRIEICSGSGPVMVLVDAQGRPMAPRYCPDLALVLLAAVAPPADAPAVRFPAVCLAPVVAGYSVQTRHAPQAQARAPPVSA